jgi:hypothetical protein
VFDGQQRADITSFTVAVGIKQSLNYHFKVRALNYVGASEFSEPLTAFAAVVPSPPMEFKIVESGLGSVSLSWKAPLEEGGSPVDGYFVYYRLKGSELAWSKSGLILPSQNQQTVVGLTENAEYSFKMTA